LAAEVTVEVNPTLDKNGVSLSELCELGATRLSLGVQSLDDRVLKHMLREHSGRAGLAALEQAALRMGPDGVSADVIVGLPPSWKERKNLNKDLETLAAFADHISV
jgi:oxygen-independent coproporphyrinogen-3 oxidase